MHRHVPARKKADGFGLPTVSSGDFSSDHWLATYAALALDTPPGH
ncbi:hypothetical protein [Streptomyces atroolivaceus]|nr:hypothetical protein [Streptomyces atroolivaceus]